MKTLLLLTLFILTSCSVRTVKEFTFREVLKYDLTKKCDEDKACQLIVKRDIQECMERANWKEFVDNQDDETIKQKFLETFYGCLRYDDGRPLFEIKT